MDSRSRNFATIVYPDSVPENWFDIISDLKIPCYISPLHDQDIDITTDENGNAISRLKKPHYHVLLFFEGKKTLDQVKEVILLFKGHGCEVIKSRRAQVRYLCHLDHPDKAQYKPEDVRQFGGLDYYHEINTSSDRYQCINEMIQFCEDNDVASYHQLLNYARSERYDWFRVLCDNGTIVMKEFLKSRSWYLRCQEIEHQKFLHELGRRGEYDV